MAKSARRKSSHEATSPPCADRRPIRQAHQQPYISSTPHLELNDNCGPGFCRPEPTDHMAYRSDYGRLPRSHSAGKSIQTLEVQFFPRCSGFPCPCLPFNSQISTLHIFHLPLVSSTRFTSSNPDTQPYTLERYQRATQRHEFPVQSHSLPVQKHELPVQRNEPPVQRYILPIRPYDPTSIVNPKMIMGPPEIQKTSFVGQYDTASSASERRAVQSSSSTSKAASTIPPETRVEPQTVNLQDELVLDAEETWEAPSFFEEAYEAIMLARAAIDSVEEELRTHEEEFWSYSEY